MGAGERGTPEPGGGHREGPCARAPLPVAVLPSAFLYAVLPKRALHSIGSRGHGAAGFLLPGTKGTEFNLSTLGVHLQDPVRSLLIHPCVVIVRVNSVRAKAPWTYGRWMFMQA